MLDAAAINKITDLIDAAQTNGKAIPMLTGDYPGMTIDDGYAVQDELLRRWEAKGREFYGFKGALTRRARLAELGLQMPCFGLLIRDRVDPEGGSIPVGQLVHPRVEAEIAFVMKDDLSGPDVTVEQVYAATDYVQPALEIIDNRLGTSNFDLPCFVADNCSAARLVLGGRPRRPEELDLAALGVVLEINGAPLAYAASGAVLGHPAHVIQDLVSWLHDRGKELAAGSVVLTGSMIDPQDIKIGDAICARFQDMGTISMKVSCNP